MLVEEDSVEVIQSSIQGVVQVVQQNDKKEEPEMTNLVAMVQ